MAFQMVRSFFGQSTPSRSRVHEPVIDSESFGNQGGTTPYDTRDVGKSADSNWFELAWRHKETSELGRKPHITLTTVGLKICTIHCSTISVETVLFSPAISRPVVIFGLSFSCLAFSCPAFSCPANWSVIFTSCIFSQPHSMERLLDEHG